VTNRVTTEGTFFDRPDRSADRSPSLRCSDVQRIVMTDNWKTDPTALMVTIAASVRAPVFDRNGK
jgi:hypothetical protein